MNDMSGDKMKTIIDKLKSDPLGSKVTESSDGSYEFEFNAPIPKTRLVFEKTEDDNTAKAEEITSSEASEDVETLSSSSNDEAVTGIAEEKNEAEEKGENEFVFSAIQKEDEVISQAADTTDSHEADTVTPDKEENPEPEFSEIGRAHV